MSKLRCRNILIIDQDPIYRRVVKAAVSGTFGNKFQTYEAETVNNIELEKDSDLVEWDVIIVDALNLDSDQNSFLGIRSRLRSKESCFFIFNNPSDKTDHLGIDSRFILTSLKEDYDVRVLLRNLAYCLFRIEYSLKIEFESSFTLLFEDAKNPKFLVDAKGTILRANAPAVTLLASSEESLTGICLSDCKVLSVEQEKMLNLLSINELESSYYKKRVSILTFTENDKNYYFLSLEDIIHEEFFRDTFSLLQSQNIETGQLANELHDYVIPLLVKLQSEFNSLDNNDKGMLNKELSESFVFELSELKSFFNSIISRKSAIPNHKPYNELTDLLIEILTESTDYKIESNFNSEYASNQEPSSFEKYIITELIKLFNDNVQKHSQANLFKIDLSLSNENKWILVLEDNGIGFYENEINNGSGFSKLQVIAKITRSYYVLRSFPGKGVRLIFYLNRSVQYPIKRIPSIYDVT
jgi:hypothetical protein